ncbi:hypothetical protein [Rhizobium leguminosarum]|uniref:hypothetical protein n=1 Tax=Rhizobium leguminosarum TaxID=384 RepID=UPI001C95ECFA|nr:hypothetical protein [Rhizobium leguminosarum]MBY5415362.1 hypothetical protein [Rhizobium leguminosarum]
MGGTGYRTVGVVAAAILFSTPSYADEKACPQADPSFVIRKTESWYDLEYKGSQIHRIESKQLNDLFGGKLPATDCDVALSSRDVMGIVVGWKKDLLIVFGVLRDPQGRPLRVNMLSWSPHAGAFDSIILNDQAELVVRYGTFATRICWNKGWKQRWEFSNQQSQNDPGPCTTMEAPFGADQYLIPVL